MSNVSPVSAAPMDTNVASGSLDMRAQLGVTLIEMLVVLTLLAIVIGLGVPGMRDFVVRTSLAAGADAFVEALNTARVEALTRNVQVTVCKSSNPDHATPACVGNTADWPEGWIVFVDQGTIGAVDVTDKVLSAGRAEGKVESAVELPSRAGFITFNPVGPITGPATGLELRWTTPLSSGSFERVICVSLLGRASLARTGGCPT